MRLRALVTTLGLAIFSQRTRPASTSNATSSRSSTWAGIWRSSTPPCTHLAVSGARWFKDKVVEQAEALEFVRRLMRCKIPRWALENPVSIISTRIRKPDCIIQPFEHGHGERKTTCLWVRNLPPLRPTNIVDGREQKVWKMGPSPDRAKKRSVTYAGIGAAMADQWGSLPVIPYKFQLGDLL